MIFKMVSIFINIIIKKRIFLLMINVKKKVNRKKHAILKYLYDSIKEVQNVIKYLRIIIIGEGQPVEAVIFIFSHPLLPHHSETGTNNSKKYWNP